MVDYNVLKPTRDFLQDIAKAVGKVQQVFLDEEPHEWHKGLEITKAGLQTPDLGSGRRIRIDFTNGVLSTDERTLEFSTHTAQEVLQTLEFWVHERKPRASVIQPEFTTSRPAFDAEAADKLRTMLRSAHDALSGLKPGLKSGLVSPVLLYPHHFDVSLAWFPDDALQYTFGFSTGDETIPEAYYYVTAYPEPANFTKKKLPEPSFWQADGFSGAIMTYDKLIQTQNPHQLITQYFKAVIS